MSDNDDDDDDASLWRASLAVLPDEVLMRVMTTLTSRDLAALARSSRRFARLANDEQLWRARLARDYAPSRALVRAILGAAASVAAIAPASKRVYERLERNERALLAWPRGFHVVDELSWTPYYPAIGVLTLDNARVVEHKHGRLRVSWPSGARRTLEIPADVGSGNESPVYLVASAHDTGTFAACDSRGARVRVWSRVTPWRRGNEEESVLALPMRDPDSRPVIDALFLPPLDDASSDGGDRLLVRTIEALGGLKEERLFVATRHFLADEYTPEPEPDAVWSIVEAPPVGGELRGLFMGAFSATHVLVYDPDGLFSVVDVSSTPRVVAVVGVPQDYVHLRYDRMSDILVLNRHQVAIIVLLAREAALAAGVTAVVRVLTFSPSYDTYEIGAPLSNPLVAIITSPQSLVRHAHDQLLIQFTHCNAVYARDSGGEWRLRESVETAGDAAPYIGAFTVSPDAGRVLARGQMWMSDATAAP